MTVAPFFVVSVSVKDTETTKNGATVTSISDDSTLEDCLVIRAILTYVRMHFGSPADYDRLAESYGIQKAQLMHATGYTDYGEETEEAPEEDGDGE